MSHTRLRRSPSRALLPTLAAAAAVGGLGATMLTAGAQAGPPADPETPPTFTRVDVDAAVTGASFTVVGEVFPGEQNIVTVGYGALAGGYPTGGGTVQIYRPGIDVTDWRKTTVVTPEDGIIFPNQVTVHDVDGDGDNDLIVPGGYFFDTNPHGPVSNRGTITWWENKGLDANGEAVPFVRHDVITGQPWSYHSVQVADLDGDGIKDLLSNGEQGRAAPLPDDDAISLQFFAGRADGSFADPIELATVGGSIPVIHDVDGDGMLDIISSQYFDTGAGLDATPATFLWLEQIGDGVGPLTSADFTPHTIATRMTTPAGRGVGAGFQIRPVPDFRGDGEIAWVGTNHTNRCLTPSLPAEEVFELTPGPDPRDQWAVTTLSNPKVSAPECPPGYNQMPIFPGDEITSRVGFGQAAPGVFGYGDIDGDGDIDLAVSGDGDRRLFWIEQKGDGSTLLHTLTAPGEQFGQSGGAIVADLDGNGVNELVFSSFDRSTVALWHRDPLPVKATHQTTLSVTPGTSTIKSGGSQKATITLKGLDKGALRQVAVTRVAARTGAVSKVGNVTLKRTVAGTYVGSLAVRGGESGTLRVGYAGSSITTVSTESSASATATLRVGTTIGGFSKKGTTKKATFKLAAKVSPGVKRKVVVQQQVCKGKKCTWKNRAKVTTPSSGKVSVSVKVPKGTSTWRLKVGADKSGLAATSNIKKVVRR